MTKEQDKAQPIAGEFVVINDYYLDNGHPELKDNAFLASIPSMAGLCECAATKSDALHELMLSLEVKLAYDLGIELSSKRHHPAIDWENKAKDMKQMPIQTAIEEIAEGEYLPAAELKWVTKILQSLLPYERECIEQAVKDNIPSLNILTEQNLSDIAKDYFTSTYKQ